MLGEHRQRMKKIILLIMAMVLLCTPVLGVWWDENPHYYDTFDGIINDPLINWTENANWRYFPGGIAVEDTLASSASFYTTNTQMGNVTSANGTLNLDMIGFTNTGANHMGGLLCFWDENTVTGYKFRLKMGQQRFDDWLWAIDKVINGSVTTLAGGSFTNDGAYPDGFRDFEFRCNEGEQYFSFNTVTRTTSDTEITKGGFGLWAQAYMHQVTFEFNTIDVYFTPTDYDGEPVFNNLPVLNDISFSPSNPTTVDDILWNVNVTDAENDTITIYYELYKNGNLSITGDATGFVPTPTGVFNFYNLSSNLTTQDDIWTMKITNIYDGYNNVSIPSDESNSSNIVINSIPVLNDIIFSPTNPTADEDILWSINVTDADNDTLIVYYELYQNGNLSITGDATGITPTPTGVFNFYNLSSNLTTQDDIWTIKITSIYDGYDNVSIPAEESNSSNLLINSIPVLNDIIFSPTNPTVDD
jgi:hypothetical protein